MSTSRIQPNLLRRMTVRQILEVLHRRGPSSRADIVRYSGISAPTVSKAVSTLLESGLLEEGDSPEGALGRPGKLLQLAREGSQVIGVVLDAAQCHVVVAGLDGLIDNARSRRVRTPGSYRKLIDRVCLEIDGLLSERNVLTLGIGLSIPGQLNQHTQESLFSPNLRVTNGHRPALDLADRFGIDAVGLQETHALCLAERLHGGARELDDFAMLDISTGLGLGVMTGGELLAGRSGLAGELGHTTVDPAGRLCGCGNHGCLETLATDSAFASRVSEAAGRTLTFDEAADLIDSGQLQAATELNETCEYLSIALAAAINLFNPETLFIHGRLLTIQDGLFDQVVDLTRRRALGPSFEQCRIRFARSTKQQGAVAGIIRYLTTAVGPLVEK